MKTVVALAVDGSTPSAKAHQFLSRSMIPDTVDVLVVSVAERLPRQLQVRASSGDVTEQIKRKMKTSTRQVAREVADETADRLRERGFDVEVITPVGRPGPELCDLIEERGIDQVVMGKRGRSAVRELLLGSTSQYLLHHANCAVTVLPENA